MSIIKSAFKLIFWICVGLFFIFFVATCTVENAKAATPTKVKPHKVVIDHCIDHREWLYAERSDKTQMEKSMGVYQDGRRVSSQNGGKNIIVQYPKCGMTQDEGFYQISYSLNKAGYYMGGFFSEWVFGKSA